MHADIKYRADVDGLRAVAVMLVILYHYKIGPISGGFVGVDVFFVISGYLITSILWREISSGRFSIYRFYERRIRRIVPPLLVVVAATLVAAWFVLLPEDYASLGQQALSAMFGVSNLYFRSTHDYFARDAALSPLLHTWSLSVEEQFYLVWPAALLIAWKASRRFPRLVSVKTIVVIVIAGSFLLSVAEVADKPVKAFYLPVFRAWELALGGLLVFLPPLRSRLLSELAPLAGLTLIAGAALLIGSGDPFPGALALPPCIGAALIVWPRSTDSAVGRLLSTAPVVWIGKLSYSLYLWHWPILVLFRHENYGEYPGFALALSMIALCFLLALLTGAFVETPVRNPERVSRHALAVYGVPIGLAVATSALALSGSGGFPGRLPVEIMQDAAEFRSPLRETCHLKRLAELPRNEKCILGDRNAQPDTFVWGDSHGVELSDALSRKFAADHRSLITLTISACPPAVGYKTVDSPHCAEDNERILQYLTTDLPTARTVVLASYHFIHLRRAGDLYPQGLVRTVERLVSAGKQVIVVGPTPEYSDSVPAVSTRMLWRGEQQGPAISRAQWDGDERGLVPMLEAISRIQGATVVDASSIFCDSQRCRFTMGRRPLLFDSNHPSMDGAMKIADLVYASLEHPLAARSDAKAGH